MPALAVIGAAIASYLAFVEVMGTEAVCGPVDDCNRLQLSPYARVAGIPVGVLGLAGYLTLAGTWAVAVLSPLRRARLYRIVWGMALAGVAFSAYLTLLGPFVIGATCIWCLNSAVVMTLILLAATPQARLDRSHPAPSRAQRRARARDLRRSP